MAYTRSSKYFLSFYCGEKFKHKAAISEKHLFRSGMQEFRNTIAILNFLLSF